MSGRRYHAVLLDAFGTLIHVDDPFRRLQSAVRQRLGVEVTLASATAAFTEEIGYYADHCHEGRDAGSLASLRADCAAVVLRTLEIDHDPHDAVRLLIDSIRFRAYDDAPPTLGALEAAGIAIAVVSNADYTLPSMLREAGISPKHVFSSAATGASKPDPAIFRTALHAVGVAPDRALHVGDTPAADGDGAAAAGIDVRILDRGGDGGGGTIRSLTEILELVA